MVISYYFIYSTIRKNNSLYHLYYLFYQQHDFFEEVGYFGFILIALGGKKIAYCWFYFRALFATTSNASLTIKSSFAEVSKNGISLCFLAHPSASLLPTYL